MVITVELRFFDLVNHWLLSENLYLAQDGQAYWAREPRGDDLLLSTSKAFLRGVTKRGQPGNDEIVKRVFAVKGAEEEFPKMFELVVDNKRRV